jgi:hypothetical protein
MCLSAVAALQKLRFEFGDVYTVSVHVRLLLFVLSAMPLVLPCLSLLLWPSQTFMCLTAVAAPQKLRFEFGDVYTVSVASFFGCEAPSSTGPKLWGDVSIAFTCDPANKVSIADMYSNPGVPLHAAADVIGIAPSSAKAHKVHRLMHWGFSVA